MCDIRRAFTYNSQMALIVRGEADRVALAEKLIADLDKPKSEVVIDVLVLEHNTDNSQNLALGLTDGLNTALTYNGTNNSHCQQHRHQHHSDDHYGHHYRHQSDHYHRNRRPHARTGSQPSP